MPSKFRTRTIVFTSYKKEAIEDPEHYIKKVSEQCLWALGQVEKCPETGRLHIQGMAYAKEAKSWAFMSPDHIEVCKDPAKSIIYCTKEETRIKGPYESGVRPTWNIKGMKLTNKDILSTPLTQLVDEEKIHIRDYEKLRKCVNLYNLDKKTEKRVSEENLWIVGQPGVGKSYWVREQFGDSLYLKAQNKWWDGYNGEENVLIDDFDQGGKCLSHYLKIWGDSYDLTGEIKGGTIKLGYKRFIITSNYTIDQLWGGEGGDPVLVAALERRFTVKDMVARGKFD
ncbi:Rep [uncultured virus]|uniref:Rep n=1 Tax=uncultured virus TaxID=340016 RepID=A0A2K9LSH2_9VIRU|nr:Rep [uncultured virus]